MKTLSRYIITSILLSFFLIHFTGCNRIQSKTTDDTSITLNETISGQTVKDKVKTDKADDSTITNQDDSIVSEGVKANQIAEIKETVKDKENEKSLSNNSEKKENILADDNNIKSEVKAEELLFQETFETVYAVANVRIRTHYTTDDTNVVAIMAINEPIERVGYHKEWSKVLYQGDYCYVKSEYLTKQKPSTPKTTPPEEDSEKKIETTPAENEPKVTDIPVAEEQSFAAELEVANKTDKLVCVIGNGGSDCTVTFHIKDENGMWRQQFSINGDIGSKGISYNKKEGDKQTPAGLYSFTLAFGIKSDPGALLTYRKITDYDYWVDDVESPYYNTWVNAKETPGDYRSEHLIDHSPSYNYALNINYNSDNTPGLGSAVFLHCYNGTGRTTGCIAIEEDYMKSLVKQVDSSTMILIVPSNKDLSKY